MCETPNRTSRPDWERVSVCVCVCVCTRGARASVYWEGGSCGGEVAVAVFPVVYLGLVTVQDLRSLFSHLSLLVRVCFVSRYLACLLVPEIVMPMQDVMTTICLYACIPDVTKCLAQISGISF